MNGKEIVIKGRLDNTQFNREIDEMQKKLRQISTSVEGAKAYAQVRQTFSGQSGAPQSEADRQRIARYEKEAQERALRFADEQQKKATRTFELEEKKFKKVEELRKLSEKASEEEKRSIEKKISLLEKQREILKDIGAGYSEAAKKAQEVSGVGGATPAPRQGFFGRMGSALGVGNGNVLGGALSSLGLGGLLNPQVLIGAAIGTAVKSSIDMFLNDERRILSAQGGAVQNLVGTQVSNVFSGQNLENVLFSKQRGTAIAGAQKDETKKRFLEDLVLNNPALAGAGYLLGTITGDERLKAASIYKGTFGVFGEEKYASASAGEFSSKMQERYQAELMKNPVITSASRQFMQNYRGDIGLQRLVGMSDEQLDKFLSGGEFSRATLTGELQGISGAGGSTAAMRNLAPFSARMARERDVTNASQLVGMLSRSIGDTQGISNAVLKQLAEATRLGLDTSETRKFMESSTQLSVRAGARDEEAANRIKASFAAGVVEKTPAGLEAAMSAKDVMNMQTSATTGARGAVQWSSLRAGKLGGIDKYILSSFRSLTEDQILALPSDAPTLLGAAKQAFPDLPPEKGVEAVRSEILKSKRNALDPTGKIDSEISRLRKKINKEFAGSASIAMKDKSFRADMAKAQAMIGEYSEGLGDPYQQLSYLAARLGGDVGTGTSQMDPMALGELEDRLSGKVGVSKKAGKGDLSFLKDLEDAQKTTERKGDIAERTEAAGEAAGRSEIKVASDTLIKAMGDQTDAFKVSAVQLLEISKRLSAAKTQEEYDDVIKLLQNPANASVGR